jgi:hypothetical protein
MPAPTNTSFATATDLGTLSASTLTASLRVDDSGTAYTVYFTFVAASDGVAAGALAFGDLVTYQPFLQPMKGRCRRRRRCCRFRASQIVRFNFW